MSDIILTAIVTFVISGVGGVLFQRWLNKAKPSLMIDDISFTHSNQIVDIGEDSVELVQAISWELEITNRYLETHEIIKRIRRFENFVSHLELAVKDCEKWLENHYHESKKEKEHPIFMSMMLSLTHFSCIMMLLVHRSLGI